MSELSARDVSIFQGIIKNCESIQSRLARYGIDRSVFHENDDLREMVLFPLLQIGELANHLSSEALAAHANVPWSDIVGMRHIIVHGYDTIDASWAWDTIERDVPELLGICSEILSSE